MIDRETLREEIKANPQKMFTLGPEDEGTLREVAREEGYCVEIGEMTLNQRGSGKHPLILKRLDS